MADSGRLIPILALYSSLRNPDEDHSCLMAARVFLRNAARRSDPPGCGWWKIGQTI